MNQHHRLWSAYLVQPTRSLTPFVQLCMMALVATFGLLLTEHSTVYAAPSATVVDANITTNTTWTEAGSPYEVTDTIFVEAGVTLKLEPGTRVVFSENTRLLVDGTIEAIGTPAKNIRFSGSTAQSGWWYGIEVNNVPEQPASVIFNHVIVEHAGYDALFDDGALTVGYASATIDNSIFQNNGSHGVYADLDGSFSLTNSTFTNNGRHAVYLDNGTFDPVLSNLTATGQGANADGSTGGYNAVVYDGLSWEEGEHIFEVMGLPYVLEHGFFIRQNGKLTIHAGIEVWVQNSISIDGDLVAVGTAQAPITFTGITKAKGGWSGLSISGSEEDPAFAQLEHVIIDYGGGNNAIEAAAINYNTANVTIRNSIIRNGLLHGIVNTGGSPASEFSLLVENTTFDNLGGAPIVCDDESCRQRVNNITSTNNGTHALIYRSIILGDAHWNKPGNNIPYLVENASGIDADSTMIIDPGVVVLMAQEAEFNVRGALYSTGTTTEPVKFTGTTETPGWWQGIDIPEGGFLELRNCDIGFGGIAPRPELEDDAGNGLLEISSHTTFVSNCRLHDSAGPGIRVFTNVAPVINNNLFVNNNSGLVNDNGTAFPLTVDARGNWWGDATGPLDASDDRIAGGFYNPNGKGNSVSDRVLYDPWLTSADQVTGDSDTLVVQIAGIGRYSPGETVQYAVAYRNASDETVEDAVLRVALPANSTYIDGTAGGIFWPDRRQMFWKLGDLAPNAGGLLAVRVTYDWGLPDGLMTAIVAQLGGRGVDSSLFNIDEYLNYQARFETEVKELTKAQIDSIRAGNVEMDAIFDQAEGGGYVFGSATERAYNTGQKLNQVVMLRTVNDDLQAFVVWQLGPNAVGMAIESAGLSIYKPGRGVHFSLLTNRWKEIAAEELKMAQEGIDWSECMLNCIEDKAPGEVAEELIKVYSVGKKTVGCVKAAGGDNDGIVECSKFLDKVIPGYGLGVELVSCSNDCKECEANGGSCDDDKCHCCTEDKYRCSADDWLYGTLGIDVIKLRKCGDEGIYLAEVVQTICALCEKCVMGNASPVCVGKNTQAAQLGSLSLTWVDVGLAPARADMELVSSVTDSVCEECQKAKDPNEISGPTGDLLPGQLVTYTIDYENVGGGVAFSVFIVNPLSEYFDLNTLTVHTSGVDFSLSQVARTIYFQVGDLAGKDQPGSKGQVTYSIRLKAGLPSGTVIANQAVVHFPSVPEVTPTNTAVNTIQPISVPSQRLQVVAGQALPITLQGSDVSDGALTFAMLERPVYGTLAGAVPSLTYTPQANFVGIDRLVFTASNGSSTSRQAEVVIEVLPAAGDSTPPTVKFTNPANGSVVDASEHVATHANGLLYTPYIQIQFSEAMKATSVSSNTIEVKDGAGQVVPVSVQYDATVDQAVLLMHEPGVDGATYTVTVKPDVTDESENPLSTPYVWSFSFDLTENPVQENQIFLPMTRR